MSRHPNQTLPNLSLITQPQVRVASERFLGYGISRKYCNEDIERRTKSAWRLQIERSNYVLRANIFGEANDNQPHVTDPIAHSLYKAGLGIGLIPSLSRLCAGRRSPTVPPHLAVIWSNLGRSGPLLIRTASVALSWSDILHSRCYYYCAIAKRTTKKTNNIYLKYYLFSLLFFLLSRPW